MLTQTEKTNSKSRSDGEITKQLNSALNQLQDKEPGLKKDIEAIKIENCSEVADSSGKKVYLIQVNENCIKNLHSVHNEVLKKLEDKFSAPVVIVPNRKKINGNLFRKYKGPKVPRSKTLTHVYDTLLEDVLFPATIVGKRIRFPQGKARVFKVHVDSYDKDNVSNKTAAISAAYKALTNRELIIEFPKNS